MFGISVTHMILITETRKQASQSRASRSQGTGLSLQRIGDDTLVSAISRTERHDPIRDRSAECGDFTGYGSDFVGGLFYSVTDVVQKKRTDVRIGIS